MLLSLVALRRLTVAAVLAAVAVLAIAASASAHTDLDTAEPADGSTVEAPVERIVLTYTLPVTPLGDAVVVTGPDGPVATAVEAVDDGTVLVATPSAPLEAGDYDVEWTVAAQDGHPLDGVVSFSVAGGAGSPSATPTPSPSPATPAPADAESADPEASMAPPDVETAAADQDGSDLAARVTARAGSAIALWALLVGGGALAFVGFALRGADAVDAPRVLRGVRWCGALLLGGLALRLLGRSALLQDGSFGDAASLDALGQALAGTVAWVFALQAAGGVLMLTAFRSLAASALAIVGVLVAGGAHIMGGHSATIEPRALVLAADIAHLVASAVWLGGAAALAGVLRARRREARGPHVGPMVSRMSVAASATFVVVGIAGVALALLIADELSDLWTSTWGISLLVKVGLVIVVAAIGAHTHFVVVPRLTVSGGSAEDGAVARDADAEATEARHLRRALAWELVLFTAVVVATAVLVASSTHT